MPRIKLNQKAVDRLKAPDPSGKQRFYFDTDTPGFGVRCSGTSPLKVYVVQRDLPNGKTRRVVVATTEERTFEEARAEARDKIYEMRKGVDPKAARKGETTLRDAIEGYLLAGTKLSARSVVDYRRTTERYLKDWMDRRLSEITPDMVEEHHRTLGKDVGHATANLTMRTLRAVYNYSIDRQPDLPPNPTRRLKRQWFKVPRRQRLVKADHLKDFYKAVAALPNPIARDYLLLLLFTGLRRSEAASLTWADVDFKAKLIRIPAEETKTNTKLDLPMTDYVYKLLRARREMGDTGWVFPANSSSGHISEPKFALGLVAEACGIAVSVHDLRRTYITAAESSDISPLALKALVNHSVGSDVTSGYVIMTTDRLREPAQRVADQIKGWCGLGS